jgi:hypothetical protein
VLPDRVMRLAGSRPTFMPNVWDIFWRFAYKTELATRNIETESELLRRASGDFLENWRSGELLAETDFARISMGRCAQRSLSSNRSD